MKISPSLMCMDLLKFKEQIEFIDSHADYGDAANLLI